MQCRWASQFEGFLAMRQFREKAVELVEKLLRYNRVSIINGFSSGDKQSKSITRDQNWIQFVLLGFARRGDQKMTHTEQGGVFFFRNDRFRVWPTVSRLQLYLKLKMTTSSLHRTDVFDTGQVVNHRVVFVWKVANNCSPIDCADAFTRLGKMRQFQVAHMGVFGRIHQDSPNLPSFVFGRRNDL